MRNQFGIRIKGLRIEKNLLQKDIAVKLNIDTPMLSKIERGERRAKKEYVLKLAKVFNTETDELLTLWLADQVLEVVKNEGTALQAIIFAETQLKFKKSGV